MPLSKLSIMLRISILLSLAPAAAASDAAIATATELAPLASSQHALQAKFDARLRSKVDAVIEEKVGRVLAARATQPLHTQTRLAARSTDGRPATMRAVADGRPSNSTRPAPNTICKMVGRTFECVLRDAHSLAR